MVYNYAPMIQKVGFEEAYYQHEPSLLKSLRTTSRAIPRRLLYILLGFIGFVFLFTASVKTQVVKLPELDQSEWFRKLWHKGDFPSGRGRKAVVISSYASQNTDWIKTLNADPRVTSGWEVYKYITDRPEPEDWSYLTVDNADGREALTYLTYIVNFYDTLPDYIVFVHGHWRAWHQVVPVVDRLATLNLTALQKEKYISLTCQGGGCDEKSMFYFPGPNPFNEKDHRMGTRLKGFWDDMMEPHGFGPLPPKIGRQCCAQFAVSKDIIRKRSLQFWKDFRDPLLLGEDHLRPWSRNIASRHKMGLIYEMVWHILFGKQAVNCPTSDYCEKTHFQDLIHCSGFVNGWAEKDGWEDIVCTNDLRNGSLTTGEWAGEDS